MKAKRTNISVDFETGKPKCEFVFNDITPEQLEELTQGELDISINKFSDTKTLSQNNYVWQLMTALSHKIHNSVWSVYLEMIRKNKNYDDLAVVPDAVEKVKLLFRLVEENGERIIYNNQTQKKTKMIALRCYKGMSKYNRDELNDFITLVVEECENLNIPTSPELYRISQTITFRSPLKINKKN